MAPTMLEEAGKRLIEKEAALAALKANAKFMARCEEQKVALAEAKKRMESADKAYREAYRAALVRYGFKSEPQGSDSEWNPALVDALVQTAAPGVLSEVERLRDSTEVRNACHAVARRKLNADHKVSRAEKEVEAARREHSDLEPHEYSYTFDKKTPLNVLARAQREVEEARSDVRHEEEKRSDRVSRADEKRRDTEAVRLAKAKKTLEKVQSGEQAFEWPPVKAVPP